MGKLAYRTADDEFKTFVGFAYRQLYGDGVLGDLSDETLDKIEEETNQRIKSLTKHIDNWLDSEGRQRGPNISIAYVPVNYFKVYGEMEMAGVPPIEEDRHDVMALCVLKAARDGDRIGCMITGASLAEYVGAKSMFDDKTKAIYQHGKKDKEDRVRARKLRSEKEGDPTGERAKELYDADVANGVTPNLEAYASALGLKTQGGASKALARMGIHLGVKPGRPRTKK